MQYDELLEILKKKNFQKRLDKLSKKYKDKKILLYGAGLFFDVVYENFDLSAFNIIGISDRCFQSARLHKGFKAFPPEQVSEQNPDLILIMTYNYDVIEKFFKEVLLKGTKIKYEPVFVDSVSWIDKLKDKFRDDRYDRDAVYLEISSCCNARCSYCPTGVGRHNPKTKFMSPEKFEEIIKHLIKIKVLNKKINTLAIYNWGEPFIHPQINEILAILGKYNLKAVISSNFIKSPNILKENYKHIYQVIFSLCSFDKEQYKRIYKADLEKVLYNFDKFLQEKKEYNPGIKVNINWLKYKFNKDEFDYAKKYFNDREIYSVSENYYASLADLDSLISLLEGQNPDELEYYDIVQASCDIDFEREKNIIKKFAPEPDKYVCSLFKVLTIGEEGQLVGCCGIHSDMKEYHLGDILTMDKKMIYKRQKSMAICKKCNKYSLDWYIANSFKFE